MAEPIRRIIQPPAYVKRADKAFADNDVEGFCNSFRTHKEFGLYCKQVHDVERRMRAQRDAGTLGERSLEEYETLAKKVLFVDKASAVYKERQEQEDAQARAEEQADAEKREQDEEYYRSLPDEDEDDLDDDDDALGSNQYEGPIGIELM